MPNEPLDFMDLTLAGALIAGLAEAGRTDHAALRSLDAAAVERLMAFAAAAAAITCSRRGADLPRRSELPASAS